MERWYVLHTKTSSEQRVASALERRDIESYLPMLATELRKEQKSKERQPLFPGYLFARFDLASGNPANWKWVPGLRYLVGYGDKAVPLPDEMIGVIERGVHKLETSRAETTAPFKPGDVVRIKSGPFANMLAIFDRACTPSKRVQILLEALDRSYSSYRLKIAADQLEKAPKEQQKQRGKRLLRGTRGRGRQIRR